MESSPTKRRRKRPGSVRFTRLVPTKEAPLVKSTTHANSTQTPMKEEAGSDFVLPPPGTDLVFLREGANSPVQVPGPTPVAAGSLLQVRAH